MRSLLLLIAVLTPTFVSAEDAKPVPLAQYVSFCLALWEGAEDIPAKASALGLETLADLPDQRRKIDNAVL